MSEIEIFRQQPKFSLPCISKPRFRFALAPFPSSCLTNESIAAASMGNTECDRFLGYF